MHLRQNEGLMTGLSIPIKTSNDSLVGISLASERADARTDRDALGELYALANQFCLRRAELLGSDLLTLPKEETVPYRPALRLVVPQQPQ
jgi:hypothetical protein